MLERRGTRLAKGEAPSKCCAGYGVRGFVMEIFAVDQPWIWLSLVFVPAALGLFSRRVWISLVLIALNCLAFALLMWRHFDVGSTLLILLYLVAPLLVLASRWRARRGTSSRDRAGAQRAAAAAKSASSASSRPM